MTWVVIVLLATHLLCVNVAAAGPLVCIAHEWRERRGLLAEGRAGRSLAWWSIVALLLGLATGVLLGWAHWSPELKGLLRRLDRKVSFGVIEIGFSLVLMIVHACWWRGPSSRWRGLRCFVLLLAGTNLIYHFPTLFAVLAHLRQLEVSSAPVTSAEFRGLLAEPAVLAYALHVTLASFAVVGAVLIWRADRCVGEDDQATAKPAARLALAASLLQLPVGVWLTTVYPAAAQRRMMGEHLWATAAFMLSLLAALSLLHHLAAVSFRGLPASRRWSVGLTVAVVSLMSASLVLSRGL